MAKGGFADQRYRRAIAELVKARHANGMSQTELATKLGRLQQFVSKYETGERRLDVIEFYDIAHALGVDGAEVIKRVDD